MIEIAQIYFLYKDEYTVCVFFQILCLVVPNQVLQQKIDGRTLDSLIAKNKGHEDMEALDLQDELFADVGTEKILEKKRPTTKARKCLETRQKWTLEEEAEIKTLFKKYFERKVTPTAKSIKKHMKPAKNNKGKVHKRSVSSLKNKVLRMYRQ